MALTLEEIKIRLEEKTKTIKIISDSYTSGKCEIKCKCLNIDCNHEWTTSWQNLYRTPKCPECEQKCKMNQNKMIKEFKNTHGERYIYDKSEYINGETKVVITCRTHGDFQQSIRHHIYGYGCNDCGNESISIKNSAPKSGFTFADKYPNLIKYFKDKNEATSVGWKSNKKVATVCPDCGEERYSVVYNIPKGYICKVCSDKISIPEKFGINMLKQLNIDFETQKIFNWSDSKRYDFYFKINGEEYLLEAHGSQHYNKISRGKSLQLEQENDLLKYNLAIENGIKPENYIVIDCRKSEFEWLKENYAKSLNNIFDLKNLDLNKIWENCQSKISIKLWDMWNNKKEHETSQTFAEYFGISKQSVINILKTGNKIGKCIYDSKEEMKKNGMRQKGKNTRKIYQYTLEMEYIREWNSISNVFEELGFNSSGITHCAKHNTNHAYGFKWFYNKL